MGGRSGDGDQTVTNRTEPDPVTQAWRNRLFQIGGNLWNQGIPGYYPGNTVVPFSNQTQQGLNMLQNQAMNGTSRAPGYNDAMNAMRGLFGGQAGGLGVAQGFAQGSVPGQQALWQTGNQMLRTGTNGLREIANGAMADDALRGLFDSGSSQVADAVNSQFVGGGRFGANGANTGELTRGIGDLWNQIYVPAYENNQNRMLQASQALTGYGQAGLGGYLDSRMGGAQLAGDLQSQHYQDQARGAAMLPGLWNYGQMPGMQMLNVGGAYEDQAQNYLNDDMARWDYQANAPWDYAQRFSQLMSGMPDFSGSTQTTSGPGNNQFMSGMGGAASGFALGNMIFPGVGGFIGAGLGGLGGLFG